MRSLLFLSSVAALANAEAPRLLQDATSLNRFVAQDQSLIMIYDDRGDSCGKDSECMKLVQKFIQGVPDVKVPQGHGNCKALKNDVSYCRNDKIEWPLFVLMHGPKGNQKTKVFTGSKDLTSIAEELKTFANVGFYRRDMIGVTDPSYFASRFKKLSEDRKMLEGILADNEGSLLMSNFARHLDALTMRLKIDGPSAGTYSGGVEATGGAPSMGAPPKWVNEGSKKQRNANGKVVELDTIDPAVKDVITVVKFFAPWCGHCKKLTPTWEELAKWAFDTYEKKVTVAKLDCTKNAATCQEHDVSGYPTLKAYLGNTVIPYKGNRDLSSLKNWLTAASVENNWSKDGGADEVDEDDDL